MAQGAQKLYFMPYMTNEMKKEMFKILRKIKRIFRTLYWSPYLRILRDEKQKRDNITFFEGSVKYRKHSIQNSNWGDDLNFYLFNEICKNKFICVPYSGLEGRRDVHYLLIGSVLTFFNLDNSIVYGSGIQYPSHPIHGKPLKILSVRGPKTRKVLLSYGIDCPEKYGDPVLLLPKFYMPSVKRKNIISIIPNEGTVREKKDGFVKKISRDYGCRIINLREYHKWQEIIDQIYESRLVISESLHGLITAETYGIPSVWAEFTEHPPDWNFKFQDFYESIGKFGMESHKLYENMDWDVLMDDAADYKKAVIDYEELSGIFPFEIKKRYSRKHDIG